MIRRAFLATCASALLFKNRIKQKLKSTFRVYKNGKLIYEGENKIVDRGKNYLLDIEFGIQESKLDPLIIKSNDSNIKGILVSQANFDTPITIKNGETLKVSYSYEIKES